MKYNFGCTACGKCCNGVIPLTWKDAQTHSSRFPICFFWTPVEKGARDFAHALKIGAKISVGKKELAVIISPYAYIPSQFNCPELNSENKCSIHETKPSRCRTMPFYPYKDEKFQAEQLKAKAGWECDFSLNAPIVYENTKILNRLDFDNELNEILEQTPLTRKYAEYMAKYYPQINSSLVASIQSKTNIITSLSTFMTATRYAGAKEMAVKQIPVLEKYLELTKDSKELENFFNNYKAWHREMAALASQKPAVNKRELPINL